MINIQCALCGNSDYKVLYKENFNLKKVNEVVFSARRVPDRIHYRIVKCNRCGLTYSNPILTTKEINKLYEKSDYTYAQYEQDLINTYGKYLNVCRTFLPPKPILLEIGCGNGFFLKYTQNLGFNVKGVEPGKETVKKAHPSIQKKIIIDIFKKGQFEPDSFDIICLFQVLDHLPDPNALLKECHKILKKTGIVLCINHDVDSLSSKILKEKSPIIDIEHTYLYNKKTLAAIFEKNGFTTHKVFDVMNNYPLSYWLRMFPMNSKVKEFLQSFLKWIKLDEKRLPLKPGNIGILALKNS